MSSFFRPFKNRPLSFFSDLAILHFMIELKNDQEEIKILSGIKAVQELKNKLKGGDDIIGLKIADLDTLICQNDCSGHGFCKQETRTCVCESFWIENFVRRSLMDGKSNCGKSLKNDAFWREKCLKLIFLFRMVCDLRRHFYFTVTRGFNLWSDFHFV